MSDTSNSLLHRVAAGDILLFSNSHSKTSWFIRKSTCSEWNHAALVAGIDPQDGEIYIHEYPVPKKGVSKQKLSAKIADRTLLKVCLIRDPQLAGRKNPSEIQRIINDEFHKNVDGKIVYSRGHAAISGANKILAGLSIILLFAGIACSGYYLYIEPVRGYGLWSLWLVAVAALINVYLGISNVRRKSALFISSEHPVKGSFCSGYVARIDAKLDGELHNQRAFASLHSPQDLYKYARNVSYERFIFDKVNGAFICVRKA